MRGRTERSGSQWFRAGENTMKSSVDRKAYTGFMNTLLLFWAGGDVIVIVCGRVGGWDLLFTSEGYTYAGRV